MSVISIYPLAKTWNYTDLAMWAQSANIDPTVITLICLGLIIGPLAKCAQIPLQLWLDEAMEGPLPASILRNAIVVSVGAYVLIQLQPVLELSLTASTSVIVIGSITAILASLIAIAQVDLKRILSYTVSAYMGLVFIAVGSHHPETALKLIFIYAIAMALLYMSIGAIILNSITQDVTQLGGLWSRRPLCGIALLVGMIGLTATPPFGGFWILTQLADQVDTTLIAVITITNALTAFSLTRLFCLIFTGKSSSMTWRSPELLWMMIIPMMILMGYALHLPLILYQFNLTSVHLKLAIILTTATILGIVSASLIYGKKPSDKPVSIMPKVIENLFANDLYIQQIYKITVVGLVNLMAKITYWGDRYIIDGAVNLVGFSTLFGGQALKYSTSGQSQLYLLSILLGLVFVAVIFGLSLDSIN